MAALALAGCMQTSSQVATAPGSDLDAMAYGQPAYSSYPTSSYPSASADSGGAISAVRASFAASPRITYTPVTNAYATAPVAATHDLPYHLDAGDKLRVVVYGQEGLTNTYAIDAGGSITWPLQSPPSFATAISASLRWRWKLKPTARSSFSARSPRPANILMCRT
jgi:polysaccharide export outer membrane protein